MSLCVCHLAHLGGAGLGQEGRGGAGAGAGGGGGGGCRRDRGLVLGGRSRYGDVLDRDAVRGDVVDLPGRGHVDQVVGLDLDLVARRQEGVEAHDEVGVALEELRHSADHPWGVDAGHTQESQEIQPTKAACTF